MFVCIRSQQMVKWCVFGGFGCEMCFVCVVAVTVFFAMWGKKLQHSQCFGCVRRVHALEATAMFGRVQVCVSMMVAEIQQC